jgi:hypothetical protein
VVYNGGQMAVKIVNKEKIKVSPVFRETFIYAVFQLIGVTRLEQATSWSQTKPPPLNWILS